MLYAVLSTDIYISLYSVHREYWKIYRGPGFFVVVWFCSSPTPSPFRPVSFSVFLCVAERACWREMCGGRGRGRSQLFDRESPALYKSFNTLWFEYLSTKSVNGDVAKSGPHKMELKIERKNKKKIILRLTDLPSTFGFWVICKICRKR